MRRSRRMRFRRGSRRMRRLSRRTMCRRSCLLGGDVSDVSYRSAGLLRLKESIPGELVLEPDLPPLEEPLEEEPPLEPPLPPPPPPPLRLTRSVIWVSRAEIVERKRSELRLKISEEVARSPKRAMSQTERKRMVIAL